MKQAKLTLISRRISYAFIVAVLLFAYFPNVASAAQITARKVVIGSSVASANTTYNFTFTASQATTIKSVRFQACDTASGSCTQTGAASGFSSSTPGSSLTGQPTNLGSGGSWTVDNSDATSLRIKNTTNTGAPTAGITVNFSSVHNPSATNSTFFMRITTYSDDAWTPGNAIDTGTVASSTAGQITVQVAIDEILTFTLASSTVTLGTPTTSSTGSGTSTMTASTNANTGYSISYSGATLTSGSNTITAMAVAGASATNSKQFGINLMSNATPAVGTNKTGGGSGAPLTGYDTADQFKFNTAGDAIASASVPTNDNTYTTSYIVNMNGVTAPGLYSTILTYTATANF